jgi:hypothetical protein
MTDTRFPERFITDRRIRRLSDTAYRLYVNAMVWSVVNRTDGVIYNDDLSLIPDVDQASAGELIKAELWRGDRDRWLIVDFAATQTSRDELEVLENARRREREKKARQRAAHAATDTSVPRDSPPGRPPGHVPGTTQEGQEGQEGRQLEGELAGNSRAETCAFAGCDKPARNGCRTCWPHAKYETEFVA